MRAIITAICSSNFLMIVSLAEKKKMLFLPTLLLKNSYSFFKTPHKRHLLSKPSLTDSLSSKTYFFLCSYDKLSVILHWHRLYTLD